MKIEDILTITLSSAAVIISIIGLVVSFIQNKKLHNENKTLQVLPELEVQLLFFSKILGRIERRDNGIDHLNVMVTKYDEFYTKHDVYLDKTDRCLFTVFITNRGNGLAKNIKYQKIRISGVNGTEEFSCDDILFSCSAGESKANKVYSEITEQNAKEVSFEIEYEDILGRKYINAYLFERVSENKAEYRLLSEVAEL